MAHGFLRRLFEVFERCKTPVDVVTTSEVSVSVTVDDRAAAAGDHRGAVGFARSRARSTTWRSSAWSAKACTTIRGLIGAGAQASVGDVPLRMVSQAASRRNVTFVIREADLPAALGRLHEQVLRAGAGAGGLA